MPECDFVDLIVDVFEQFMPKFISIYRQNNRAWSSAALPKHIKNTAAKGNLKIETEAREQHSVATNRLRLHQQEQWDYHREGNWYYNYDGGNVGDNYNSGDGDYCEYGFLDPPHQEGNQRRGRRFECAQSQDCTHR